MRPLLGKDAVFPPNEAQQAAIEATKTLICEEHVLAVPDERAAILAAQAWMAKRPAAGLPFSRGATRARSQSAELWAKPARRGADSGSCCTGRGP